MDHEMKILVIGDLHGQMPRMHFKGFDAIVCVGDFCLDKEIRKYSARSYRQFLSSPMDYRSWWEIAGEKKAKRLLDRSIESGRKILEKLDSYDVPVYVIPGNWDYADKDPDWRYTDRNWYKERIIKGLKNVKDCHRRILRLGAYQIIGYGIVSGPELLKHRHYKNIPKKNYKKNVQRYKKLVERYDSIFKKAKHPVIFLSHNVPFNTRLDKITNKDSPMKGHHYGSNLARDMVLKHRPILCIGGHMHEHYGTCRLGKTIVLNAGFGGEKNTLISLDRGRVQRMEFYGKRS